MAKRIRRGDVLVSTMVRGAHWCLAYEVTGASVDDDTVTVRPIEWLRYTAMVDEVTGWGEWNVDTKRKNADTVKRVDRVFGRPVRGEYCGPAEERQATVSGKFHLWGVAWHDRNEVAFIYTDGHGYPVSLLRNAPPPEKTRGSDG